MSVYIRESVAGPRRGALALEGPILLGADGRGLHAGDLAVVALDVDDLDFVAGGVRVMVRQSKIDQEGHGAVVGVPNGERPDTCPVRWLAPHFLALLPVSTQRLRTYARTGSACRGRARR